VNRYGGPVLQEAFLKDKEAFVAANSTFQPANATCLSNVEANVQPCIDCAVTACKTKIESDCAPTPPGFWEGVGLVIENEVLDPVGDFFVDDVGGVVNDIGSFFEDDVGGAFGDVGDFFADDVANALDTAFGDAGNWFENDFANFWKEDFAGGVVAVGEEIGDFFSGDFVDFWKDDFAGGIGSAAGDVANFFEHDFTNAFDDAAGAIGGAFEDFFGDVEDVFSDFKRRRRRSVDQSGPEPTCDQLSSEALAGENCPYYAQVSYCAACSTDPDTVCPGYLAAYNEYVRTGQLYIRWKTVGYKVNSVTYDFNPNTGGFENYKASVDIFGVNYQVEIPDDIEIHDNQSVGAVVAVRALTAAAATAAK